jgi:hypothetical protein
MGQSAQNGGRRASLDDKKERMAGRANTRAQSAGRERDAKGKTGGAFGKNNVANRRTANATREGGDRVGRSTKRARPRGKA